MQFTRVKNAYQEKEITVKNYFSNKNLNYKDYSLFLRAFKRERKIEVWIKQSQSDKYELLTEYDFCTFSGVLGPKRKEGDRQIPEGVYHINHFNPVSNFHLSLGINYPNKSDKLLGGQPPGGAIYIHGDCVTIGCIPITDDKIKELYILAVEARNNGQLEIPVHIFPAKLTPSKFETLKREHPDQDKIHAFWLNLQQVYNAFEKTKSVDKVKINAKGEYYY